MSDQVGGIQTAPLAAGDSDLQPFNPRKDIWRRYRRNKAAMIGSVWAILVGLVAIFAPLVQRYDPSKTDALNFLGRPSRKHWLGGDRLGRDVWARLVSGARISFTIALFVTLFIVLISLVIGGICGFYRGKADSLFMRFVDVIQSIPYIVILLAFVFTFGQDVWVMVAAITFLGWTGTARLFRSSVMAVGSLDYIEAAKASGCGGKRILFRHITPNAIQPILVAIAFAIGGAISSEATFSFLGVGLKVGTPSWGVMIADARDLYQSDPHLFFSPVGALTLTVLAFVFIGDGVRDALDPKLRGAS
jgi:peptide/nickel transport system permease protein